MSRPQVEARIRAAQPAPVIRARPPVGDMVPPSQRAGVERTAVLPQNAPNRAPAIRQTGQFRPLGAPPPGQAKPPGVGPESVGAIALPRPPVQPGTSRGPISQRTAPAPAPGTVRTAAPRKTASLPPTPNHPSAPPPRSAEPPPLDDLVPRARSERPRHSRPPVSHRSQPPRDRPRFLDRSPEPRAPGGGLPGPDSFGRLPAPLAGASQFPPAPSHNPEETMAMARSPYAAQPPPRAGQVPGEYYPPPQPHGQTSRSFAPPPPAADTYRDHRDANEYYPHLHAQQAPHAANPSASYDQYPPPGYLPPGDPRMAPALGPVSSRGPMPSVVPAPYVAPAIEAPTFMGLVLFAAPLALATLAVAALALM